MAHVDNLPTARWTTASIVTTDELFTNKPQVWPELRKSYGQGILTFDLIGKLKGSERFIGSDKFTVHEENPPFRTMHVLAVTSGGAAAGATIKFTLNDVDMDTDHYSLPRVGGSFWAGPPSHLEEFTISAVTAGGTDPTSIDAFQKDSLNAQAAVPNTIIYAGVVLPLAPATSHAEGVAASVPTHVGYKEVTFYTEVLKDAIGFENAELAREMWTEYEGVGLYNKEVARMDMNLDATMEAKILFGVKNTNTLNVQTSLATGGGTPMVGGVQGLWDWIDERGYDIDFTNTTDFTIDHFYELAEFGESVGLPASTWLFDAGATLLRRIEKSALSYITNATGSLNELFTPDAGGGQKDLTIGFRHIVIGGQTIVLKSNYIMNNPYLFGISTLGLKDAAIIVPLGNAREGKTGEMIPNLLLLYRGLPGYHERKRAFAPFVGVGGPKAMMGAPITLEGDISKVHATVDFGFAFLESWRGARAYNTDYTGTA